jgi:hypothetical protein
MLKPEIKKTDMRLFFFVDRVLFLFIPNRKMPSKTPAATSFGLFLAAAAVFAR